MGVGQGEGGVQDFSQLHSLQVHEQELHKQGGLGGEGCHKQGCHEQGFCQQAGGMRIASRTDMGRGCSPAHDSLQIYLVSESYEQGHIGSVG